MRRGLLILLVLGFGSTAAVAAPLPEVRCGSEPARKVARFRHIKNRAIAAFGDPLHPFPAFTASVANLRPTSRGSVRKRAGSHQALSAARQTPSIVCIGDRAVVAVMLASSIAGTITCATACPPAER